MVEVFCYDCQTPLLLDEVNLLNFENDSELVDENSNDATILKCERVLQLISQSTESVLCDVCLTKINEALQIQLEECERQKVAYEASLGDLNTQLTLDSYAEPPPEEVQKADNEQDELKIQEHSSFSEFQAMRNELNESHNM